MARPVLDRTQLTLRTATINCSVSAPGRPVAVVNVAINVRGVAQPSLKSICTAEAYADVKANAAVGAEAEAIALGLAEAKTDLEMTKCATTSAFTTNGNATIVVVGGTCDSCPQPPFDSTTIVRIGGVAVRSTIAADGLTLMTRTPSIMELLLARGGSTLVSDFLFGYVNLTIENYGHTAVYGGSVDVGPGARRSVVDRLACSVHGLCPDTAPDVSGIFYTQVCDGFADPTEDTSWSDAGTSAQRFAYGVPPSCRACPLGCRCPGGERCHVEPGFYAQGEGTDLGTSFAPARCAAPALRRCPGYSAAQGSMSCGEGYAGSGCTACAVGHRRQSGGTCAACATTTLIGALVLPLIVNTAVVVVSGGLLVVFKAVLLVNAAMLDVNDERPSSELWRPALTAANSQALAMIIATVTSLQIAAVVSVGAVGEAPPLLSFVHTALATLRFELPLTHIDCVSTFESSDLALTAAWLGAFVGIVLALVAMVQSVPWLRAEQLCFGWQSCGTKKCVTSTIRPWLRLHGTPILRFALSSILLLIYVPVVHAALSTLICHSTPTVQNGVTWSLAKHPSIVCFSAEYIGPAFVGSAALLILGIAWPLITVVSIAHRFALRDLPCDGALERCNDMCLKKCERVEAVDATAAPAMRRENASERAAASSATRQLIELGLITCHGGEDARGAELIEQRLARKGLHGRAYHPFLRTPFESHYFWMIPMRLYCMLLLSVLSSTLATSTPTAGSVIALFVTTNGVLFIYGAVTLGFCSFRDGARWHIVEVLLVCALASMLSLSNLAMGLSEVKKASSVDADLILDLEWMIAPLEVVLIMVMVACAVLVLSAYFASGTLSCLPATTCAALLISCVNERDTTTNVSRSEGEGEEPTIVGIELTSEPSAARSIDALFKSSTESINPIAAALNRNTESHQSEAQVALRVGGNKRFRPSMHISDNPLASLKEHVAAEVGEKEDEKESEGEEFHQERGRGGSYSSGGAPRFTSFLKSRREQSEEVVVAGSNTVQVEGGGAEVRGSSRFASFLRSRKGEEEDESEGEGGASISLPAEEKARSTGGGAEVRGSSRFASFLRSRKGEEEVEGEGEGDVSNSLHVEEKVRSARDEEDSDDVGGEGRHYNEEEGSDEIATTTAAAARSATTADGFDGMEANVLHTCQETGVSVILF